MEPDDDEGAAEDDGAQTLDLAVGNGAGRLDRALAEAAGGALSRARLQALIAAGAVEHDGRPLTDASARAQPGRYRVHVPPPTPAAPAPQHLPLVVLYEDADLIVVDKLAGMAAHPAPGTPDGTLVNALLFRCGAGLSGIGGVARPGIVHRLDKDTSGVMVAAKTDRAHRGLSALFAAHDLERSYVALVRGAPSPQQGRVETRIGRSPFDRKKMAVLRAGGRQAVTLYATERTFGDATRPAAAQVRARLETGRTHQIRVHMAHLGAPVLGDPVYGSGAPREAVREAIAAAGLERQALHAAVLGFRHPVTGAPLRFETPPPPDMLRLAEALAKLGSPAGAASR